MGLDARGIISVIELIVYLPLLPLSGYLILKHGFKREGWIYLLLLSIVRIVGAITHIASELSSSTGTTLHTIYGIMEASGLSPLLSATLGFLGTIAQHAFHDNPLIGRGLKIMNVLGHVALALAITGGVKVAENSTKPDQVDSINSGIKLRHIGVILFLVQWLMICATVVHFVSNKFMILKHRRTLLTAIAISLPFLGIRVLYAILSAFAPTGIPFAGVDAGSSSLSSFTSNTGSFGVYLVMSVVMELIALIIYVVAGLRIPLQNDYIEGDAIKQGESNMYLYSTAYAPNARNDMSVSSMSVSREMEA